MVWIWSINRSIDGQGSTDGHLTARFHQLLATHNTGPDERAGGGVWARPAALLPQGAHRGGGHRGESGAREAVVGYGNWGWMRFNGWGHTMV